MFIRSPTRTDKALANALVASTNGCAIDASLPDCDDPTRLRRIFVVVADSQVLGVGVISANWLHPTRLTLEILVTPGDRRSGIGTALLGHLVAAVPANDDRPLKAACWDDDETSTAFWSHHGFVPIMCTDIGAVDFTAQANVPPSAPILPDDITIVSDDRILRNDPLWDDIATLHERIYRANHEWSPVAAIDLATARQIFLDPNDVVPNALYATLRDMRPYAVASLRALTNDGHCELGWAGGDPVYGEDGQLMAGHLVTRCLRHARNRGWTVNVEADRSDPVLQGVIQDWPLVGHRIWIIHSRSR